MSIHLNEIFDIEDLIQKACIPLGRGVVAGSFYGFANNGQHEKRYCHAGGMELAFIYKGERYLTANIPEIINVLENAGITTGEFDVMSFDQAKKISGAEKRADELKGTYKLASK